MRAMKKLLLINSVLGFGSTGRIVLDIAGEYEKNGYEVKIAYGRSLSATKDSGPDMSKYGVRIGSDMGVFWHGIYTRLTDKHGLRSYLATRKFLKWADKYDPDVLWLHNIHGYYINYEMLFDWIKKRPKMQVKWTLHDCWAFTGHCSHFSYVKCDKWKTGCNNCPQTDQYPKACRDNSRDNYNRKKAAFTGVKDMTIITPSKWLKEKVQEGFLSEYPVEVHYNTINTDIFKPTSGTFKEDHGISGKKMILGVSSVWNDRKGLNDLIELSKRLDSPGGTELVGNVQYQIVLVGLTDSQIKEIASLAPGILALPRTGSAGELAEIYSAADVFVNPSYEETFGLTVAEAQACGTYTIVYKDTACAEIIDRKNGESVDPGAENLERAIKGIR